jgi:ubiquinone/menaquinone biosynthesis C-methylase UbiE
MPHKFDPRNMAKLEERKKILPPDTVLLELGLGSGDIMLDVGAGAGYFALPAAKIVGSEGCVIAVDTSKEMLAELTAIAAEAGVKNIEIILSSEYETGVEDERADFALLSTVLHEVENKSRFLESVGKALKKNGRLAIVEWIKSPMEKGPPLHDRIGDSEAAGLLEHLDFNTIKTHNYNHSFYFVTAVK